MYDIYHKFVDHVPKLPKNVITYIFLPLHTKIATPTGTAVPVKEVQEISSIGTRQYMVFLSIARFLFRARTLFFHA